MNSHEVDGRSSFRNLFRCAMLAGLLLATTACTPPEVTVAFAVSADDANEIAVLLGPELSPRVDPSKEKGAKASFDVVVPGYVAHTVRAKMLAFGLPRPRPSGLEAFSNRTGFGRTRADERAQLMAALAGEAARSFEVHPDVITARVHVVIPDKPMGVDAIRNATSADAARGKADGPASRPMNGLRSTAAVILRYRSKSRPRGVSPDASDAVAIGPFSSDATAGIPEDAPFTPSQVCATLAQAVEGMRLEDVAITYVAVDCRAPSGDGATVTPEAQAAALKALAEEGVILMRWPAVWGLAGCGAVLVAVLLRLALGRRRGAARDDVAQVAAKDAAASA